MRIVITDLDGTLLDTRTYSWAAARPALEQLKRLAIPLVFATSKTCAEVEYWREQMGIEDPFIVENGGALYVPRGYFGRPLAAAGSRGPYEVLEFGRPYHELVEALQAAANQSVCEVRGFHELTATDLAVISRLPLRQAVLAKQRDYDEPFEILSSGTYRLLSAIQSRGLRWTRGDRFYHVTGGHDKVTAVERLLEAYRAAYGQVISIGVGDGHNDARFLAAVDVPIVIHSRFAVTLRQAAPRAILSRWPGPSGWNEAVLRALVATNPAAVAHASACSRGLQPTGS